MLRNILSLADFTNNVSMPTYIIVLKHSKCKNSSVFSSNFSINKKCHMNFLYLNGKAHLAVLAWENSVVTYSIIKLNITCFRSTYQQLKKNRNVEGKKRSKKVYASTSTS